MAAGSIELLALTMGQILGPLEDRLAAGEVRLLFAELGLDFPPELDDQADFVDAIATVATDAARLAELVPELLGAIEADDSGEIVRTGGEIVEVAGTLVPALSAIATQLEAIGGGALPGISQADLAAFAADLPGKLLDHLVVGYLEGFHPILLRFLALFGIVELIHEPGDPNDPTKPPYTRRQLRFDRLGDALAQPETLVTTLYQWGDPAFDGELLLERLHDVLFALAIPATFEPDATPPSLGIHLLRINPRTDLSPPGMEAVVEVTLGAGLTVEIPILVPGLTLGLSASGAVEAGLGIQVQPPADVTLIPPSGELTGKLSASLAAAPVPPATALTLLSVVGGSRLEAGGVSLGLTSSFTWDSDATPARARGDFGVEGHVERGRLVISLAEADGFLSTLVGGFGLEAEFDLGIGWTAGGGLYFTGSAALEIQLPVHVAIGPIELTAVTLTIGMEDGHFPIATSANITAALGPLVAVVEEIGAVADLSFPDDNTGNLGPADLELSFKPPSGVGLSLDAEVVKGGGYLYIDADRGEYAGALELTFAEVVSLKAIGLITTTMPDGSSGFSLLIIITAEFGTGIQLGFGFTLLAVGGLVGLNRSMNLQALTEGIRTGAVESVMFPQDVVANAPKIISDLRAFFPVEEGTFLIGPMAKLGWGSPTLISLSMGIIIEIPGDIAILGILKVALPADDVEVLVLQVNFVGAIEPETERLWFFAALFESRVLTIPIEGEMGLLVAWGADATFVVSVGGFHPRYLPPPLPFPSPRRVSVMLVNTSAARVRVDGYFAVTSNTVQFGAAAEVFFGVDGFNVDGHLAFDALFQFSPFYFIIEISASFSVKVFGAGLFSVRIRGSLEGPTPWRVRGDGSISLLFFEISVDFDVTFGERQDTILLPIAVLPLARAELEKQENWTALPPPTSNLLVSLRALPSEEAELVLHPIGVLRVSQRLVPLALTLDKVGNQEPSDVDQLTLDVTGGELTKLRDTYEEFAPAQFEDMSDAEKLSSQAFAPEVGGLELSASGDQELASSRMVKRVVRYEQIIIDSNFKRFSRRFLSFPAVLFNLFAGRASVARSDLSQATKRQYQPFDDAVAVAPETFSVVFTDSNRAYAADTTGFVSEAGARDYLAQQAVEDPNLAQALQVVPTFEAVAP